MDTIIILFANVFFLMLLLLILIMVSLKSNNPYKNKAVKEDIKKIKEQIVST